MQTYDGKMQVFGMQKQEIDAKILKYLAGGQRCSEDVYNNIDAPREALQTRIKRLKASGKIVSVKHGIYALPEDAEAENSFFSRATAKLREKSDNAQTINTLLNLYDDVLIGYSLLMREVLNSNVNLESKERFLKDFKDLTLIGDRLLKRWNLENFGYDANTRQAQEDAKAKARKVESEDIASLPPEERVVVVGEYDSVMKELWDNLPESEKDKKTV